MNSIDLIQSFVEDCREHLDSIEASLMDIEAAGEHQNSELVNGVFRLAHSIKGGAGMLGLDNIKTLAHKLENVLHMVRSKELFPSHAVVDVLLKSFDRLTALVDNIEDSENMSIETEVARLLAISEPQGSPREGRAAAAQLAVGGTGIFSVDALSLEQAKSGGNELYLLEFDLIHDIHGNGRMPLEVLKALTDTGRIVDCKVDVAAAGDLDGFGNSIPFYVLYATILEPKYVSGLVKLPTERVRHLDAVPGAVTVTPAPGEPEVLRFGEVQLLVEGEAGRLALPENMDHDTLEHLQAALLAGMERCATVTLDFAAVLRSDLLFQQLLLAAEQSYARRGKRLLAAGELPEFLHRSAATLGFGPAEAPGRLLPEA